MKVLVHDCLIDTDCRQVRRRGLDVRLTPKAYTLLELLLEARPRPVAKEILYRRLWPDTFVVGANLPNLISEIRAALGDGSHPPRIIRTLHGYGYAFCGQVEPEAGERHVPAFSLRLQDGRAMTLHAGENIVGRGPGAELRLEEPGISRRHARLVVDDEGRVVIEDLGSTNGTFVRGERVRSALHLTSGDAIAFGPVRATFHAQASDGETERIVVGD